jgi:hypothetical protein
MAVSPRANLDEGPPLGFTELGVLRRAEIIVLAGLVVPVRA